MVLGRPDTAQESPKHNIIMVHGLLVLVGACGGVCVCGVCVCVILSPKMLHSEQLMTMYCSCSSLKIGFLKDHLH